MLAKNKMSLILLAEQEEGEVDGSTVTEVSRDDDNCSIDDGDWSRSESSSEIAERIRQKADLNGFGRTAAGG
jgi:hypothetical protein